MKPKKTNEFGAGDLSLRDIVLILNAEVNGRQKPMLSSFTSEDHIRKLKSCAERSRRQRKAFSFLELWKKEGTYFPVGTARYLTLNEFHVSISAYLGVLGPARRIIEFHNESCPNCCIDLIHAGQLVPDLGIAMLNATTSAMTNYSLITATSPQLKESSASEISTEPLSVAEPCFPGGKDDSFLAIFGNYQIEE